MTKIRPSLVLILLAACNFLNVCHASAYQEYVTINKALKSISKVIVKYKSEFDTKVQFFQLHNAIEEIDKSMLEYQGVAKQKLNPLKRLNSEARHKYQDCVESVYEWCISVNSTFDVIVPHISDTKLPQHYRDIIWDIVVQVLSVGQKKTSDSLKFLNEVQKKTMEIKNILDGMLHDLSDDFGPTGFYGKEKDKLQNAIADNKKNRNALIVAGVISFIFGTIMVFITGPIGVALALGPMFVRLGMEGVVNGNRKATYEEQLKAIEEFFNVLDKNIRKAIEIAGQVNMDLEEDKINLQALSGLIFGADINKQMLLLEHQFFRSLLVPEIQKLSNKCYEYRVWHESSLKNCKNNKHARHRRQASESCKERQLRVLSKVVSSNDTFSERVSRAHAILSEMDCGEKDPIKPISLPLSNKEVKGYSFENVLLSDKPTESDALGTFSIWSSKYAA